MAQVTPDPHDAGAARAIVQRGLYSDELEVGARRRGGYLVRATLPLRRMEVPA